MSYGEIDILPVWTPDSRRVLYASAKNGPYDIFWRGVDGTTSEQLLLEDRGDKNPYAVSPDGTTLAYRKTRESETGGDVWLLPLTPDARPSPFFESVLSSDQTNAVFSPDGKWLAYESDESGRAEIYVRAFPDADQRRQISTEGGSGPLWAPSGRELFYRNVNEMLVVEIDIEQAFRPGRPRVLFEKELEFPPFSIGARPREALWPQAKPRPRWASPLKSPPSSRRRCLF